MHRCPLDGLDYETAKALADHTLRAHDMRPADIESMIEAGTGDQAKAMERWMQKAGVRYIVLDVDGPAHLGEDDLGTETHIREGRRPDMDGGYL